MNLRRMATSLSLAILSVALLSALAFVPHSRGQENLLPGQRRAPKTECATIVTPAQIKVERARGLRGYPRLVAMANRPYHIPLTIHIVRRDNGTDGFTLENLAVAMQDLNRLWLPLGMQFYQRGAVDYIDNDRHFSVPDSQARRDELRGVNVVANTINVYFTNLDDLCGQSTFTASSPQGVLMNNGCAGVGNSPSTFAHEIGHYFDLYHTHETGFGVECPAGNNCAFDGDLICDTPADPELDYENNVTAACVWTGSAAAPDGCDSTAYNPPTRNLMSYSRRTCRDTITGDQSSKALNVLTTASNRSNLINSAARYVAPDGITTGSCTYRNPCRTVARAVEVANPGDSIFILNGVYVENLTINKAVFLRKWNTDAGSPTIGQ